MSLPVRGELVVTSENDVDIEAMVATSKHRYRGPPQSGERSCCDLARLRDVVP